MGDYDRRIKKTGEYQDFPTVQVSINGNVEIDKGDFIFLDRVDGLREKGTSTASYKGFPFSKVSGVTRTLASNQTLAQENFLGIAAWHSDSGVTENIAVYTSGLFNYPLKNSKTLKPFYFVVPTGSGVTLDDQKITIESSSTKRIGIVAEYGTFKMSSDILIGTIMNPIDSTIY